MVPVAVLQAAGENPVVKEAPFGDCGDWRPLLAFPEFAVVEFCGKWKSP